MMLRLGGRLVNLFPLAQRTKTFTLFAVTRLWLCCCNASDWHDTYPKQTWDCDHSLALLVLQSHCGDTRLTWSSTGLSPKRDCGPKSFSNPSEDEDKQTNKQTNCSFIGFFFFLQFILAGEGGGGNNTYTTHTRDTPVRYSSSINLLE